jgi:hypothetical protein
MANLVMAIIGAQYASPSDNDGEGIATIRRFVMFSAVPEAARPSFWEGASVVDREGALNIAVLAYWPSTHAHRSWENTSGFRAWWDGLNPEREAHGWFLEVLSPTVDRFETVFSNNQVPEGAAHMREQVSGELLEHGYWGSMRDRFAVTQDDDVAGVEKWSVSSTANPTLKDEDGFQRKTSPSTASLRISVPGKKNLCVIRSGQDWSDTLPEERSLYLETMHPVLIEGMNFLRDNGREVGCYNMNLWDVIDTTGSLEANLERAFGLGYFDDLSSLERWSKSHQTHIDIFGGFLRYAKKLDNVLSLRLFHEVLVLEPSQQFFEYVGCHGETGMLGSLVRQVE